ncbi:winged helix-turn-helix domain-containing protein [Patescibacteria group bacterium]|nr:winged helix-turn-helix domain-containing protein [Patescibacteria group bacterium]
MSKEEKSFYQLERIVRGFSNHRRIEILELLKKSPELAVVEVSGRLKINFKTAAEHIRRLAITGLVLKRSDGHSVRHKVSERGEQVLKFLRTLE